MSDKSQPNIIIQTFKFIFLSVPSQFSKLKFRQISADEKDT